MIDASKETSASRCGITASIPVLRFLLVQLVMIEYFMSAVILAYRVEFYVTNSIVLSTNFKITALILLKIPCIWLLIGE